MECNKIREKLSAYIDGALSAEERDSIEAHLESCAMCSADFSDLKKTIDHIREVENVEPPEWMAQKIMARVREEGQRKKGLFEKLFYPLYIKLPLEAVAAVLVAVIALYIYRDIKPDMRLAKAPFEESAPQIHQKEIIKEDKIGPFRKSEEKKAPEEVVMAPSKPMEEPSSGKIQARTDEAEPAPPAPRSMEVQQRSELAYEERKTVPPASTGASGPVGALRKGEKKEAAKAAPMLQAFSETQTDSAVVTVRVEELENARKEIEKIILALSGKIIRMESREGKKTLMAEVNSGRLDELLERLKSVGEVKEEKKVKGREGAVRVKIEVVEHH